MRWRGTPSRWPGPRSPLLLRFGSDGPALTLAVGRARLDDALPLARVLALARVVRAGAGPLPLAGVDAGAPDLVRARLLLGARHKSAREEQGGGRAGDENALVHQSPPSAGIVPLRRRAAENVSPPAEITVMIGEGISRPARRAAAQSRPRTSPSMPVSRAKSAIQYRSASMIALSQQSLG